MSAPSSLYVYAVLAAAPSGRVGVGLTGERLRVVEALGLHAVVGTMRRKPRPSATALRRHDAVVRRLASHGSAVLPVRFGTVLAGEAALVRVLALRGPDLRQALDLVSGCEQMTLRVYGPARPRIQVEPPASGPRRPGTRYLVQRLEARAVPELAPLRRVLARVVRAERVERHDRPPLLASVYHLVPRARIRRYVTLAAAAGRRIPGLTVTVSGPWPAWAFAPEAVA